MGVRGAVWECLASVKSCPVSVSACVSESQIREREQGVKVCHCQSDAPSNRRTVNHYYVGWLVGTVVGENTVMDLLDVSFLDKAK